MPTPEQPIALPISDTGNDWLGYVQAIIFKMGQEQRSTLHFPDHEHLRKVQRILAESLDSHIIIAHIGENTLRLPLLSLQEKNQQSLLHHVSELIDFIYQNFPKLRNLLVYLTQIDQEISQLTEPKIAHTEIANTMYKLFEEYLNLPASQLHSFFIENTVMLHDFFELVREINKTYASQLGVPRDETLASILHSVTAAFSLAHTSLSISEYGKSTKGHQLFITSLTQLCSALELTKAYCQTLPSSIETINTLLKTYSHLIVAANDSFPEFALQTSPVTKLNAVLIIQEGLQNALKYSHHSDDDSQIQVPVKCEWKRVEDKLVMYIANPGQAVNVDHQGQLFQAGYRDAAIRDSIDGEGYGLYMINKNMTQLGGTARFIPPFDPSYQTTLELVFPSDLFTDS